MLEGLKTMFISPQVEYTYSSFDFFVYLSLFSFLVFRHVCILREEEGVVISMLANSDLSVDAVAYSVFLLLI